MHLHDTSYIAVPLWGIVDHKKVVKAWTLVDLEDVEVLGGHRWNVSHYGYATCTLSNPHRRLWLHREIMRLSADDRHEVDHRSRNRLDNRKSNLRVVLSKANKQNVSKRSGLSSKYRGVAWDKTNRRWIAQVKVNGRHINLGRFDSEETAAEVSKRARAQLLPFSID